MIFKPWDCAQPDEWLPQSLRLCWGGGESSSSSSGDGGGGWGGDSGGGWGGDGGFGGASTGGGDWGSAGNYDASGFNAGGDLNAWAGSPYDASFMGSGAGGGGDWGSFGDTSYAGMNAPNPTYADVAGPNPGVTTGGGDWGSAGPYSAAGFGGGPGGGLWGDSGGSYGGGGGGGGFYGGGGNYGGGGTYGGGGGGFYGSQGGTSAFGNFGGGVAGSNAYAAAPTGPHGSAFADSYGGGSLAGPASKGGDEAAPTTSQAQVDSAGPEGGPEGDPEGGPAAAPSDYGKPASSEAAPEAEAGPSLSDGAPAGNIGGKDDAAPAAQPTAAPETETSQSAFGPESVTSQEGRQALSDLTQSALAPVADTTPWGSVFEGAAPPAENTAPAIETSIPGDRGQTNFDYGPFGGFDSQAYQDATQALSNLTQSQLAPQDVNWGSVFEAPSDPAYQNDRDGPIGPIAPDPAEPFGDLITAPINPIMYPFAQALDYLANLPNVLTNVTDPVTAWSNYAQNALLGGSNIQSLNADAFDAFEAGQQGRAGANPDTTPWGSVFEAANPDSTDYASVFEGAAPAVEGLNPGAEQYGIEARTPAIEAFIPGDRGETNFDYGPEGINPGAEQYWAPPPQQQQAPIDVEIVRSDDPSVPADPRAAPPTTLPPAVPTDESGRPTTETPESGRPAETAPSRPAEQPPQAPPQVAQPVPPSLIEQAQTPPGAPLAFPGTPTTGLPPPALTPQTGLPPAPPPQVEQHGEGEPGGEGDPDQQPSTVPAVSRPPADIPATPGGVTAADRAARGPNAQPEPQHVQDARQYLLGTANPGDTMNQQGPAVAIARLQPDFAVRLAAAVREARANGLPNASVFSAFRAPSMGANPGYAAVSQHGRGGAVDMSGIGRPGSREAQLWYDIAIRNGLFNPYGPNNRAEWNHYQATPETGRQTANRLGPNPRNAPDNMVPTWDRLGVRPVAPPPPQQAQLPGGARGIGSDRSDVPWGAPAQPDVARPPADIPATVNLPPVAPQETRPPADIPAPAPFLAPPRAGRVDPTLQARFANDLLKDATKNLNKNSGEAEFAAASVVGAKALAAAGIPLAMARSLMAKGAYEGAAKNGYDVNSFPMGGVYKGKIDAGIDAAMQGYQPAKPGELLGPPAPAAPGKQGALPGQQYADLSQSLGGDAYGRGVLGRTGDVGAASPYFGALAPTMPELSPLIKQAPGSNGPQWSTDPPLDTPTPGQFSPYRGNEAALPSGQQFADLSPSVGSVAPSGMTGRPGEIGSQQPMFSIPGLDRLSPITAPPAPPEPRSDGRQFGLLDFLQNFNPISTAEAKGRGRDGALEQALALAREGGNLGGQRGTSVIGKNVFTFYAPGASGPRGMEGPMVGSKGNPLTTLDDVRNGAGFVSLAGHPNQFGQQVFIGDITYTSPVDGQQYTLNNVVGRVDDTGGKFGGRDNPDQNHFDIAVGNFSKGWNDRTAGSFVAGNYATAVPGRGIGSDYAADDQGTVVGVQPPAAAAPADMRGLAKGGHVAKDEPVVVGEEGPEVFVPDWSGTVVPHMPQPGKTGKSENIDRWPKIPAPNFPGRYGGVEREMLRQTRAAQNPMPTLMDMVDSGQLRLTPNWHAMLNDPALIALGRSRMDDRREGINPGAEQYGAFIPPPALAADPPDPTSPMAQALGYGSIKRRPMQIGRQSYSQ